MENRCLTRTVIKPTFIQYKVNDNIGSGLISRVILNQGLEFYLSTDYTGTTQVSNSELKYKNFFEINYCISGQSIVYLENKKESINIKEGDLVFHTNDDLSLSECFIMEMKNYNGFIISLCNDEIKKFFFPECVEEMLETWEKSMKAIFKGKSYFKVKAPPSIEWSIRELLRYNYDFKDAISLLLCQSKLIEIISKSVSYGISKRKEINLNKADIDEIYKAKDILMNNIESPPSIKELSRICNIDPYKLKKGFKELFNNTPYGYLREVRLHKGRYLLENTEMNLSEIANIVGYNNPSKFSEAFKIQFNITPSEYREVNKSI